MRRSIAVVAALVVVALPIEAAAQNAPAALRGKSIVVAWTEDRVQREGGSGPFVSRHVSHSLTAYVSSQGRIFVRRSAGGTDGRRGSNDYVGSAGTAPSGQAQITEFHGSTISVTASWEGGARMTRIDFDPSFASCTASVILGREKGVDVIRSKSRSTGALLEVKSVSTNGASCSVQSGNAFE